MIVGGGTAGCVLAQRLSADARLQVVVVEAGGEDTSPWIAIPAGMAKLYRHPTLNWRDQTEPEAGARRRRRLTGRAARCWAAPRRRTA